MIHWIHCQNTICDETAHKLIYSSTDLAINLENLDVECVNLHTFSAGSNCVDRMEVFVYASVNNLRCVIEN